MYDIDGNQLTVMEWSLYRATLGSVHLGDTTLGDYRISTVYIGLDMSLMGGRPLIFETMIFCPDEEYSYWMDRYSTKQEALVGHDNAVKMIQRHMERLSCGIT